MLPGESRKVCMVKHMSPGLHMYYTHPAQHPITTGGDSDDPDHYLSVRRDLSGKVDPNYLTIVGATMKFPYLSESTTTLQPVATRTISRRGGWIQNHYDVRVLCNRTGDRAPLLYIL